MLKHPNVSVKIIAEDRAAPREDSRFSVIPAWDRQGVYPVYIPSHPYELEGDARYPVDVPNVIFPVGSIVRDRRAVPYCGAGDKYEVLLSFHIDKLVDYLLTYGV